MIDRHAGQIENVEEGGNLIPEEDLPDIFQKLVLQSPISTWIANAEGYNIFENQACRDLFGIGSDDEVIGKYNIFKDEQLAALGLMPQIEKVFKEGGSTELIVDYDLSKSQQVKISRPVRRVLRGFLFAVKDDEGRVKYVVVQHEDITLRTYIEQALRTSEANLQMMFHQMPAAMFAYDREGRIIQVNSAFEELYGYTNDQIAGKLITETIGKFAASEQTNEVIERVFQGESVLNLEWEDTRADGTKIYVLTNTTPIRNAFGDVTMGISLNIDITERKLAEERQREQESYNRDFFRRTILAATDGKLVICDKEDIENITGPPTMAWEGSDPEQMSSIRHEICDAAVEAGMDKDRTDDLALAVGEALTNAFKHAGGGNISLHIKPDRLFFVVNDSGPGIDTLILPEATLKKGYSTGKSLGMGYKALIYLADRVYLATGPDGTTVAVEIGFKASGDSLNINDFCEIW